jgi:hypothetical protein
VNIRYRCNWYFNSFEAARDNRTHGNHIVNIGLGYVWELRATERGRQLRLIV